MVMKAPCRLTIAAILLVALGSGCNRSKEATSAHDGSHWTYGGETGPAQWGKLNPEWSPCGDGKSQSPIDIDQTVQADLPALKTQFPPAQLRIIHHAHVADEINNGHTIQVNYTEGDTLVIGDEAFALQQYHFHAPSEHTVGKKGFPMEMHLVHKSAAGTLAVIGVFIEKGAHNAAFDPIWSKLPKTKGAEAHLENVKVDVDRLLPANMASYRYDGSLTTPPCSEGVKWIVMATPIQLDAKQLEEFRAIVYLNNRPIQPLNGRPVVTDHVTTVPMVAAAAR
jgi:carbonic anhydrase